MNAAENVSREVSQCVSPLGVDGIVPQRVEPTTSRVSSDCVEPRVGDTALEVSTFSRSAQSQPSSLRAQLQTPFPPKEGEPRPQQPLFPVHTIVLPNKGRGNFQKAAQFAVRRTPSTTQKPQYFVSSRAGRSQDVIGEEGPTVKQHLQQQQKQMKEKERLCLEQRHTGPLGSGSLSQEGDAVSSPTPVATSSAQNNHSPLSTVESQRPFPVMQVQSQPSEVRRKLSESGPSTSKSKPRKLPPARQVMVSSNVSGSYQSLLKNSASNLPVATYIVQPQSQPRSSEERTATATQRYIVTHSPLSNKSQPTKDAQLVHVSQGGHTSLPSMVRSSSLDENHMLKAVSSNRRRKRHLSNESSSSTGLQAQSISSSAELNGGKGYVVSERTSKPSINYQLSVTNQLEGRSELSGMHQIGGSDRQEGVPSYVSEYAPINKFRSKQRVAIIAEVSSSSSNPTGVDASQTSGISNLLADDISSFFGAGEGEKDSNDPFLGQLDERETLTNFPEMLLDSDHLLCEIPSTGDVNKKDNDVSPTGFSLVDWLENDNLPMGGEMACNEDDFSEIFREDDGPLEVPDQELLNACGVMGSKETVVHHEYPYSHNLANDKQSDGLKHHQARPLLQIIRSSTAHSQQVPLPNTTSLQGTTGRHTFKEKKQRSPKNADSGKSNDVKLADSDKKSEKAVRLDRKRHEERLMKQKKAEQDALDKQKLQEEQAQKERETVERVIRLQMQQIEAEREAAEAQQKTAPSAPSRARSRANRSHSSRTAQRSGMPGSRPPVPFQSSSSSFHAVQPQSAPAHLFSRQPSYPVSLSAANGPIERKDRVPDCSSSSGTTGTENAGHDRVSSQSVHKLHDSSQNGSQETITSPVAKENEPTRPLSAPLSTPSLDRMRPAIAVVRPHDVPEIPTQASLAAAAATVSSRGKIPPTPRAIIAALEKKRHHSAGSAHSSPSKSNQDPLVSQVINDMENFPDDVLWEMLEDTSERRISAPAEVSTVDCERKYSPEDEEPSSLELSPPPPPPMDSETFRQEQDVRRDINTLLALLDEEEREDEISYLENQIYGTEQALNDHYGRKLRILKDTFSSLVFTNAALVDEISRLSNRVIVTTEERKMLARRLCHHNRNYIRRLQTAKKRRSEAEKRKQELVEKQAEMNVAEIKAKFAKHEMPFTKSERSDSMGFSMNYSEFSSLPSEWEDETALQIKTVVKGKRGRKRKNSTSKKVGKRRLEVVDPEMKLENVFTETDDKKSISSEKEMDSSSIVTKLELEAESEATNNAVSSWLNANGTSHPELRNTPPPDSDEIPTSNETSLLTPEKVSAISESMNRKSSRRRPPSRTSTDSPQMNAETEDGTPKSRERVRLRKTREPLQEGEKEETTTTRRSTRTSQAVMEKSDKPPGQESSLPKGRGRPPRSKLSGNEELRTEQTDLEVAKKEESCADVNETASNVLRVPKDPVPEEQSDEKPSTRLTRSGEVGSTDKRKKSRRMSSSSRHISESNTPDESPVVADERSSVEPTSKRGRRGRQRPVSSRVLPTEKDTPLRQSLRRKS